MLDPHNNAAFTLPGTHPGLVQGGNINLFTRPRAQNPNGGVSTVDSVSFGIGGHEVLVPQVVGGQVVGPHEALQNYLRTGQHLGVFKTPAAANLYAHLLHLQQALYYGVH